MNNYNTIFNEILKKYGNSEKWSGSIFEKMKLISNTHVDLQEYKKQSIF